MANVKKCNGFFRELVQKIIFRIKLREMDEWWYFTGANSWGLFPPSFYYTHTEEEIKRIKAETVAMLLKLIEE